MASKPSPKEALAEASVEGVEPAAIDQSTEDELKAAEEILTKARDKVAKLFDKLTEVQRYEVDEKGTTLYDTVISPILDKGSVEAFIEQRRPPGITAELLRVYREMVERDGPHGNQDTIEQMFLEMYRKQMRDMRQYEEDTVQILEFDAATEINSVLALNRSIDQKQQARLATIENKVREAILNVGHEYYSMVRLIAGIVVNDGEIRQGQLPADLTNPPQDLPADGRHGIVIITDRRLFDAVRQRMEQEDEDNDRKSSVKIRRQQPMHIFYRMTDGVCEGMIVQSVEGRCNLIAGFNLWNEDEIGDKGDETPVNETEDTSTEEAEDTLNDDDDDDDEYVDVQDEIESMVRWIISSGSKETAVAKDDETSTKIISDMAGLSQLHSHLRDAKRERSILVMTRRGEGWLLDPAEIEQTATAKKPCVVLIEAEMEPGLKATIGASAPYGGAARLYHPGCKIDKANHGLHRLFNGDKGAVQLRQALGLTTKQACVASKMESGRGFPPAPPLNAPNTTMPQPDASSAMPTATETSIDAQTADKPEEPTRITVSASQLAAAIARAEAAETKAAMADELIGVSEARAKEAETRILQLETSIAALHEGYGTEIDEHIELLKVAEDERDKARRRARRAEVEVQALRIENSALRSAPNDGAVPARPEGWPCKMSDIATWAESRFADRLVIHPRADRAMRKTTYPDIDRVASAVEMLATDYHDAKNGVAGAYERVNEKMTELRLVDNAQIQAGGPEGAQYWIEHDKRRLFLSRHIKGKESSKRDRGVLRIYFTYDDVGEKVVIGWMPDHLTTTAT